MVRNLRCLALLAAVVVAFATGSARISLQSDHGHANLVENSETLASSLVGDTVSSVNKLPFEWSSDYETAVESLTSSWSDEHLSTISDNDLVKDPKPNIDIAKNGFLKYCTELQSKVAQWTNAVQHKNDVSGNFKVALHSWYKKLEVLAKDRFGLPPVVTMGSLKGEFKDALKQLLFKGSGLMYKLDGKNIKKKVEKFVKGMADKLVEILKDIKKKVKEIYDDFNQ